MAEGSLPGSLSQEGLDHIGAPTSNTAVNIRKQQKCWEGFPKIHQIKNKAFLYKIVANT
jgi:hypothetical protein